MIAGILIVIVCCAIFWLVFFKFKLLRLTPGWGFVFGIVMLHLLLIFVIGLRLRRLTPPTPRLCSARSSSSRLPNPPS